MKPRLRRTIPARDPLYARLDEIRMPAYERLTAKAHLARAEAIAELLTAAAKKIRSIGRVFLVRPIRRALAHIG
jgi:hypothetical protein